jgi:hypothetical protein
VFRVSRPEFLCNSRGVHAQKGHTFYPDARRGPGTNILEMLPINVVNEFADRKIFALPQYFSATVLNPSLPP